MWLGTESNRRHRDFQSPALPTELPSLLTNDQDLAIFHTKLLLFSIITHTTLKITRTLLFLIHSIKQYFIFIRLYFFNFLCGLVLDSYLFLDLHYLPDQH